MTKDTNTSTASGAAIQRYKIGYHADEWGQRSSTPSGIPDASGSWVRYADHVTALAAGQATAAPAEPDPTPRDHPQPCDSELFESGVSVGLFDIPQWTAEALCKGIAAATGARVDWHYIGGRVHVKALPAPTSAEWVASAALPDEREAFEAMMRSQTFDSLKRLSDGSYESYEARVGWLAWNVRASRGQAPAGATLPDGWVPLTITHEGQHPEEVAYGPQIMMDRLGKWLGKYFAQAAQAADSVPAVEREQERISFKDAHRHLDLDEVPDAWGRPMFKHSHVEASWLGWIARASHGQAPAPTHEQIAAYLESTGAYVTNDATREAAIAEAIDTDRAKRGQAPNLHPKTSDLVQRFAAALAEKLSAAEKKYGYSDGWASPNWMDECRQHLSAHIAKGDPRDVAAYCAFLWHHGATTASPQAEQQAHHEEQPDGTTIPIDPSEMAPQQPAPAPMSPANRLVAYSAATRLRELGFEWDATAEAWLQPAPSAQAADSVQEDAARYRWLREGNDAKHGAAWYVAVNLYGCEWDAAIDAAMNKGGAT